MLRTDGEMTGLHFVSISGTPGHTNGAGAGTGPTVSLLGTDCNQFITVVTGTSPTASAAIVTVTYTVAFSGTSTFPVFSPANAGRAAALTGNGAHLRRLEQHDTIRAQRGQHCTGRRHQLHLDGAHLLTTREKNVMEKKIADFFS